MLTDMIWALAVAVVLSTAMGITSFYKHKISKELSRKIVHVSMGCVALTFPYLFTYNLTVQVLGALTIGALLVVRHNRFLSTGIGTSLFRVNRQSYGEIYFVVAIVVVHTFFVSPYEYLIAIGVLTFADSIAALVGTSYGRYQLAHVSEDSKSSEGSSTFFVVSYFCALIPLQLMSSVGRGEVLVISLIIAVLSTLIEMVSEKGNDNLLLPVLSFVFLRMTAGEPLRYLLFYLALMGLAMVPIVLIYKRTGVTKLSLAYALLVVYVVLIQGGVLALVPPVVLFVTFGILPSMSAQEKALPLTYRVIECNSTVGLVLLILSNLLVGWADVLLIGFSLAFAGHLVINTYARLRKYTVHTPFVCNLYSVGKGLALIGVPSFFIFDMKLGQIGIYVLFLLVFLRVGDYLLKKHDYLEMDLDKLKSHRIATGVVSTLCVLMLVALGGVM